MPGRFQTDARWSGQQLTLQELRDFVGMFVGVDGKKIITVTIDPKYDNPTDPGGTITLYGSQTL